MYSKHKLLSPNRFGFRKKYNCTNAITEITEYIRQKIDERNRGYVCFLDLKKAFDTINHELPLANLELYVFRGPIFHLIQNYLQNPNQYVFLQGENFIININNQRVPQGSILCLFFSHSTSLIYQIVFQTVELHCLLTIPPSTPSDLKH